MAFVRSGNKTISYVRADHRLYYGKTQEPVYVQQDSRQDPSLLAEIEVLKKAQADLTAERDALKRELASLPKDDLGLGPEFEFGRRIYQCEIGGPGVGYRNTPSFSDKNKDGSGPVQPQVVIADR